MKTSTQGYKTNSPDNKEKALLIPSNSIDMTNTIHEEIYAVPFKNGKAQKMVLMKKGGQYQFDDADYVIEIPAPRIPQMQPGGAVGEDPYIPFFDLSRQNPLNEQAANPTTQDDSGTNIVELPNQSEEPATGTEGDTTTQEYTSTDVFNTDDLQTKIDSFKTKVGEQKTDTLDLTKDERDRLYNPYATYDTRAAAHTLGRAIGGQENAATGVAAGAKVGLSLLRDTLSGYASANREQYVQRQKEEKERLGITEGYGQAGGEISYEDVMEIRNATGIDFDENFAKNYFTKTAPSTTTQSAEIDLGRYKDVGYFDIAGRQGDTIVLNTTSRNPHNAQTVRELERELNKLNPSQRVVVNYVPNRQDGGDITNIQFLEELKRLEQPQNFVSTNPPKDTIQPQLPPRDEYIRQLLKQYTEGQKTTEEILDEITPKQPIKKMQKGGKLSFAEKMTGEYEQGLPENKEDQAVVELEQGEHILQPDGTTSEVVGDKHSEGGEKLSAEQVQDGSIVISDHLKIGKENAKYFKEKYGVKVKPTDTFATVIDKIKKQIGIDKLVQEQEDVFKKIEKEEKNTKDVTTKNLNLEFLSKKVQELEEEKAEKDPQRIQAMQDVYERQEASKPVEEQEQQTVSPELLQQLSQESGMPVEQLQEFLKGGKVKKYQDGGLTELIERIDIRESYTGEEAEIIGDWMKGNPEEAAKYFEVSIGDKEGDSLVPTKVFLEWVERNKGREKVSSPITVERKEPSSIDINVKTDLSGSILPPQVKAKDPKEPKERVNEVFPLFPDQGVLPPSSIQPPLKAQIRLGRADSVHVSPEAALVEAARQRQAVMGALDSLPPAQRAAMLAMLTTQEGIQSTQAINQVALANAQQDAQTQQFNIGQADKEQALEAQNALSYEDRIFRTQAAYRENLNQYYDFLRKTNAQNFADIRNQNLVNTLVEGYQIQPDGTIKFVGDTTVPQPGGVRTTSNTKNA